MRMKTNPDKMDMTRARAVVYHQTDAPEGLMVYFEEKQKWLNKPGWVSTPAKFDSNQEPIIIETVKKKIVPEAPIHDASELSDYLNEKYGLKTNFRMGLKKLKNLLEENQ
jgi:hypothetical protein